MKSCGWYCAIWLLALASLPGCGLDGLDGQLVRIDGERYILEEPGGRQIPLHVDERTRKDPVVEGDHVHVFVTKDGHAEFIQRLEK